MNFLNNGLTEDLFKPKGNKLCVLSFGAGQDSTVLLEKYLHDFEFRNEYAPNDFLVVMSDTGDEFDDTYQHVYRTQEKCIKAGVEFVFLTSDMGFHSESWLSLRHFYKTKSTTGSRAFPKTCTDRLKIQPIYRFLEHWLSKRYGVQCNKKMGFREFAAQHGKIKMMIGISKGEEKRISNPSKSTKRWYRDSIEPIYPLIELGMDRSACQEYLHSKNMRVIPSNCKACPFASLEELEYLRRFHLADLMDWCSIEKAKLEKFKHLNKVIATDSSGKSILTKDGKPKFINKNYGVFGVTPLTVKIHEAKLKFADWSDERVKEYRYSHGHCVTTSY